MYGMICCSCQSLDAIKQFLLVVQQQYGYNSNSNPNSNLFNNDNSLCNRKCFSCVYVPSNVSPCSYWFVSAEISPLKKRCFGNEQASFLMSQIQQRITTRKYGQTHLIRLIYALRKNNSYPFFQQGSSRVWVQGFPDQTKPAQHQLLIKNNKTKKQQQHVKGCKEAAEVNRGGKLSSCSVFLNRDT